MMSLNGRKSIPGRRGASRCAPQQSMDCDSTFLTAPVESNPADRLQSPFGDEAWAAAHNLETWASGPDGTTKT